MQNSRKFSRAERVEIILPVRLALDNLLKAKQSESDVLTIYTAVLISLKMSSLTDDLHQIFSDAKNIISKVFTQLIHNDFCLNLNEHDKCKVLNAIEIYEAIIDQMLPQQMLNLVDSVQVQMRPADFAELANYSFQTSDV